MKTLEYLKEHLSEFEEDNFFVVHIAATALYFVI